MTGLLTTAEIADRLGCSERWVQSLCKRKKLKAHLIGRVYVALEKDVLSFVPQSVGRPGKNGKAEKSRSAAKGRTRRSRSGKRAKV